MPAHAHGNIEGAGDFYSGLLHPILVPAEALGIIGIGMALGVAGKRAGPTGLSALALGLVAGLIIGDLFALTESITTQMLVVFALLSASTVVAGSICLSPPLAA